MKKMVCTSAVTIARRSCNSGQPVVKSFERQGRQMGRRCYFWAEALRRRALVERVQLVSNYAVKIVCAARVGDAAEQKFAAAIAVGINRVDQFKPRTNIKVQAVGNVRERFVHLTINIFVAHYCDVVLKVVVWHTGSCS